MPLPRTLEPEVMDSVQEAGDYDAMDHDEVNRQFVNDFLAAAATSKSAPSQTVRKKSQKRGLRVLDIGTGTAQIPIVLARREPTCRITAIDLSHEMLKLAKENIAEAQLQEAIELQQVDAKVLPWETSTFDGVISNSIVHHIPQPQYVIAEMIRLLKPGGTLFVRDLLRPDDRKTLEQLVTTYVREENEHQQQLFRQSLHAALTVPEVQFILRQLGVPTQWARVTSDRHWTISNASDQL